MNTFIHPMTRILKRTVDITAAVTGLLITAPVLPFLAGIIKLTSPGPVIYKQERVGLVTEEKMKTFNMYKFRSMRNDAESKTGAVWATEDDPRLTAIGKFMRKTRLDEIPQFVNVLKGDMSLIGPRPERPCIANNLEGEIPFYLERTYGIIPGITGLAQVYQGYDQTLDDVRNKLNYDLAYSLSMSQPMAWLKMECRIIFMTIWVMVSGRGQ